MDPKKLRARDQRVNKVKERISHIINPSDITGLAKRLNVTRGTVKNWSCGYCIPVGSSMMGLCSSYGIPEEYIVKGVFKLKNLK